MEFYNAIYGYASNILYKYNRRFVYTPEDIISEVYLHIYDNGLQFTEEIFRELINRKVRYYIRNKVEGSSIVYVREVSGSNIYKYCTCCKEPKTRDDFYVYSITKGRNKGFIQEWTECKSCLSKKSQDYIYKRKLVDPDYTKRASRVRIESGAYKEYKRLGRLNLDDWYIMEKARYLLKRKGYNKEEIEKGLTEEYLASVKSDMVEKRNKKL